MTPAQIGGLLLILGSYTVYKGEIFYSVFVFFVADICWLILAFGVGDIFGMITIATGMILGLGAYWKMHKGDLKKNLHT